MTKKRNILVMIPQILDKYIELIGSNDEVDHIIYYCGSILIHITHDVEMESGK